MANKSLEELLEVTAATGPFGKGDAVLEQTLRDFIQLQSTTIAVGTQVVGVRTVPWLQFTWYTGAEGTFTYPLDDNAVVDRPRLVPRTTPLSWRKVKAAVSSSTPHYFVEKHGRT